MKKLIQLFFFGVAVVNHPLIASDPRFPQPEFTSGYQIPESFFSAVIYHFPLYRSILLVGLLALTGWALYRRRSRKILIAIAFINVAVFGVWLGGCICPLGVTQALAAAFFADGTFNLFLLFIFAAPLIVALWYGRLFCLGGCPLGALQELLFWRKTTLPPWLDGVLGFFPYLVLVISTIGAAAGAGMLVCRYDPFVGIFRLPFGGTLSALTIFAVALSIFISRPYCRYFCPYSVLLKIATTFADRKISISPNRECLHCRLCESICPNNAITPPNLASDPQGYGMGLRRFRRAVFALPPLILLGALGGYFMSEIFTLNWATLNTNLGATFAVQLRENAPMILSYGFTLGGAFIGLMVGVDLLARLRWRARGGYQVRMAHCFACGRCYQSCPQREPALK